MKSIIHETIGSAIGFDDTFINAFQRFGFRNFLIPFFSTAFFIALLSLSYAAYAQSGSIAWEDPINLSRSGGSTDPKIISTTERVLLVVWDEEDAAGPASEMRSGFSMQNEDTWSDPIWIELPFTRRPRHFITTENEQIHAFWIDDEDRLRYQNVRASDFGFQALWYSAVLLGNSVAAFDAGIDSQGVLHLAFLTTEETGLGEAGVYYNRTIANSLRWSLPVNLYSSDYFHQFATQAGTVLGTEESGSFVPDVNVETIADGEGMTVILSWSNLFLKRIFSARSTDGGMSWLEVEPVDGPAESHPYRTPRNLITEAGAESLVRLWHRQESGGSCTLTYQISHDGGEGWGESDTLLGELTWCPDSVESYKYSEAIELFIFTIGQQTYLVAWDDETWGEPRLEQSLGYFTDPETYNFVQLGCQDATLVGERLVVAGCDLAGGGDIWFLQGQLGDLKTWFQPESGWNEKAVLEIDSSDILSMSAAYDSQGMLHTLWSQQDTEVGDDVISTLFYSGWDGERAIGPFVIMEELPGLVTNLSLISAPGNQLIAVWNGGQQGEIFYASTSTQEATSATGWQRSERVINSGTTASTTGIHLDLTGAEFLAYAVPANEGRGLYLTRSHDQGHTWEQFAQAPLPSEIECPLIQDPGLLMSSEDSLHIIWTCSTLPGGAGELALYHTQSKDGGERWEAVNQIVDEPVLWSDIVDDGQGALHLVWVEQHVNQTRTRHCMSVDGGRSWSDPTVVFTGDRASYKTVIKVDQFGQVHLLQMAEDDHDEINLLHKTWADLTWSSNESLKVRLDRAVTALAADVNPQGDLTAVYSGSVQPYPDIENGERLIYAQFEVEVRDATEVEADVADEASPASSGTVNGEDLVTGETTEDQDLAREQDASSRTQTEVESPRSNLTGLIIGGVASLAFVIYMIVRRLRPSGSS